MFLGTCVALVVMFPWGPGVLGVCAVFVKACFDVLVPTSDVGFWDLCMWWMCPMFGARSYRTVPLAGTVYRLLAFLRCLSI